ncbi:MAG: phosphatase PAP2 family protein [Planctomycetes bacterium]|nr:phosphatase PAP2 family protein [Planctomycetota bacterium]
MSRQLHPALVHLLLAGFCLIGFTLVAEQVSSRGPITTFDYHQAIRFNDYVANHPVVLNAATFVTDLGAGRPRFIVICSVAILLILHRQWRLAILWGLSQWLLKEVVAITKDAFERPRPDPATPGWSFPSGHATGAMVTYGMLAYLVAWKWATSWIRWPLIAVLGLIIIVVGLSRMLMGVHWFTDILGGFLLGMGYVSIWVAAVEWGRKK